MNRKQAKIIAIVVIGPFFVPWFVAGMGMLSWALTQGDMSLANPLNWPEVIQGAVSSFVGMLSIVGCVFGALLYHEARKGGHDD